MGIIPIKGINRQPPEFLFIDIDRHDFDKERLFQHALTATLLKIENILGGHPSVLWTGNGYHIYQPIDSLVLEQEDIFSKFENPSERFVKYAAIILSHSKCDMHNTPTFRSCLLRVPGTYNGKCSKRDDSLQSFSQVKLIQKWNGYRPASNPLLYDFFIYLANEKVRKLYDLRRRDSYRSNHSAVKVFWIEKLLQISIADGRKFAIRRILAPYLINIRKLSYEVSYRIISEWLEKCDRLQSLDNQLKFCINYNLNSAKKIGYKPIGLERLKGENLTLYTILFMQ